MAEQSGRHPATVQLLRWFEYEHLPVDLRAVSAVFARAAHDVLQLCGDGPELSAGLRKLLEAKDCAVRQRIADRETEEPVVVRPPDPDLEIPAVYGAPDPLDTLSGAALRPRVGDTPQA